MGGEGEGVERDGKRGKEKRREEREGGKKRQTLLDRHQPHPYNNSLQEQDTLCLGQTRRHKGRQRQTRSCQGTQKGAWSSYEVNWDMRSPPCLSARLFFAPALFLFPPPFGWLFALQQDNEGNLSRPRVLFVSSRKCCVGSIGATSN